MAGSHQSFTVINAGADHTLKNKHLFGGRLPEDTRYINAIVISVVFTQLACRGTFKPEVKFNIGDMGKLINRMNQFQERVCGAINSIRRAMARKKRISCSIR